MIDTTVVSLVLACTLQCRLYNAIIIMIDIAKKKVIKLLLKIITPYVGSTLFYDQNYERHTFCQSVLVLG